MVKKPRSKSSASRPLKNQRREKVSFAQVLSSANRRAHEQANRRGGKRAEKFVWAAVAAAELEDGVESAEWVQAVDALESGAGAAAAVLGDELDVSLAVLAGHGGSGFLENGGVLVFRDGGAGDARLVLVRAAADVFPVSLCAGP